VVLLIFVSGKIVLTGAKDKQVASVTPINLLHHAQPKDKHVASVTPINLLHHAQPKDKHVASRHDTMLPIPSLPLTAVPSLPCVPSIHLTSQTPAHPTPCLCPLQGRTPAAPHVRAPQCAACSMRCLPLAACA
jgi:hypothetical protein